MLKIRNHIYLPSLIFSFCILEMVFDNFLRFHTVYWFYGYFLFFLIFRASKLKILFYPYLIFIYLGSIFIYIAACIGTKKIYDTNTSELFNIIWWTVFGVLIVTEFNNNVKHIKNFINFASKIVFIGGIISSIWGLSKFILIINNTTYPENYYDSTGAIIPGSSLNSDYNIFSLGLCICILFGNHLRTFINKKVFSLFYIVYVIILSATIFLSGSRRGFFYLIISIFLIFFLKFKGKEFYKGIAGFFKLGIPALLSVFVFLFFFYENIDDIIKNSDADTFPLLRILTIKNELSSENERTIRWKYFFEITNDFSIWEYLKGNGFDYLRKYGSKFEGVAEDNPHNFLLSSFLYGGIIALIFTLLKILFVIIKLFKNESLYIFLIIFLYFLGFGLTSSNSLFSYRLLPIIFTVSLLISVNCEKKQIF